MICSIHHPHSPATPAICVRIGNRPAIGNLASVVCVTMHTYSTALQFNDKTLHISCADLDRNSGQTVGANTGFEITRTAHYPGHLGFAVITVSEITYVDVASFGWTRLCLSSVSQRLVKWYGITIWLEIWERWEEDAGGI